jgi:hypothetical protein
MAEPNPSATADAKSRGESPQGSAERDDFALGFECADPRLQIESWGADDARVHSAHAEFG